MKSILFCILFLLMTALLWAETTAPALNPAGSTSNPASSMVPAGGNKTTAPTVVTSDQFKLDMSTHEGIFTGNVVLVGTEFKMKSREMFVYFDEKNQVKRLVSRGDVEIEQPDRQTKSGQAEYLTVENKIILTETPQVIENQKTVSGTTITMYRNSNKMDVDGHSRVLIYGDIDATKPTVDSTPAAK
jgi:lipopolysaccharide export system protein LptA